MGKQHFDRQIAALHDKDWKVRRRAAEALEKIGDKQAVESLMRALKDKSKNVRQTVIHALGELRDKRSCEPLIKILKESKNTTEKNRAAFALGRIGDSCAVEPLIVAFQEKELRWNAGYALGQIRDKRAVEPLIKGLEDEFATDGATFGLLEIGEPALEPLVFLLENGNSIARRNVIHTLRQFWGHGQSREFIINYALQPLINALKDPDDKARAYAVILLCEIHDVRSLAFLVDMVKDVSEYVRWCLAWGLRKFRDMRTLPALEWIKQNDNGSVLVRYDAGNRREFNKDIAATSIEYIKQK